MAKEQIKIGETDAVGVIDLQNDFALEDGALYVAGIKGEVSMMKLVAYVKKLYQLSFGFFFASRDRHPGKHIEHEKFGLHCVVGTKGAELLPDVVNGVVLDKGDKPHLFSFSLSASSEWPVLIWRLREMGITRIFLCGLAYNYCVGETAIDLVRQGFEVYVIRDATRSVPPPYGDPALMDKKLELYGVKCITMNDLVL